MTSAPKGSGVPRPGAAQAAGKAVAIATTLDDRLRAEPGTVIAGKFRLDRPLGRGAMGSVWVARHLDLDIPVAVKLMLLDSQPDPGASGSEAASQQARNTARGRFEREAKAAAQLRSANIVRILDYGVYLSSPYMVMELLEGEDLAARLVREPVLPPSEVARILVPIARALQLAHDAGLVHRDLKPGNIFLAMEGDDEVPKILDFGIARSTNKEVQVAAGEATIDGMLVGTPSYMSPEQATGCQDIDHRSDLWALGVVAFRALTGRKPFPGPGALDAVVQICSGPIPKPSDYVQGLPPEVDEFIGRALERDRELRFQAAKEMARALTPFLPRSYSSRPPPARGAFASSTGDNLPDPDSIQTRPGYPDDVAASELLPEPADVSVKATAAARPPGSSKLSIPIVASIAITIAIVSSGAWFATRKTGTLESGSSVQSASQPASASAPAVTAAHAEPKADDSASAAAPSASTQSTANENAPPRPSARTAAPPPKTATAHTAVTPPPPPTSKGRDLGY